MILANYHQMLTNCYSRDRYPVHSLFLLFQFVRWRSKYNKYPADRIIVSLSRRLTVPLLTCDRKILDYEHVVTVW